LTEMLLQRHGDRAVTLSECAQQVLLTHRWPGNVRELENLLQRSLILHNGATLTAVDLAFEPDSTSASTDGDLGEGLRSREHQLILDALNTHEGKRTDVARALGISARCLRYKLARMRAEGLAIPGESP